MAAQEPSPDVHFYPSTLFGYLVAAFATAMIIFVLSQPPQPEKGVAIVIAGGGLLLMFSLFLIVGLTFAFTRKPTVTLMNDKIVIRNFFWGGSPVEIPFDEITKVYIVPFCFVIPQLVWLKVVSIEIKDVGRISSNVGLPGKLLMKLNAWSDMASVSFNRAWISTSADEFGSLLEQRIAAFRNGSGQKIHAL